MEGKQLRELFGHTLENRPMGFAYATVQFVEPRGDLSLDLQHPGKSTRAVPKYEFVMIYTVPLIRRNQDRVCFLIFGYYCRKLTYFDLRE